MNDALCMGLRPAIIAVTAFTKCSLEAVSLLVAQFLLLIESQLYNVSFGRLDPASRLSASGPNSDLPRDQPLIKAKRADIAAALEAAHADNFANFDVGGLGLPSESRVATQVSQTGVGDSRVMRA